MPASLREDVSPPFLALGLVLVGVVAVGYLYYPDMFSVERELAAAYGGLLALFSLVYCYRPLRESRYGRVTTAAFIMLFALVNYVQGIRGPLMPYGLFGAALAGFCYELYKLGSTDRTRGQVS